MNLTIDIGNTNTKLGFFEGLELKSTEKYTTNQPIEWKSIILTNKVSHAIVSQVRNQQLALDDLYTKTQCLEVHHQLQFPFTSAYEPFTNLGIDRVVGLAAATYFFPKTNALIIDAGTCITYDFITANANHLGGIISPGLSMRYQAMHKNTHQLPNLEIKKPTAFPPADTNEAMHYGVICGITAEIKTFIKRFEAHTPNFMTILTGGDAGFLSKRLKNSILADANFLAFGLNLLLETNKS